MKQWYKITIAYLVLVGAIGLLLRYSFISSTGFVFQYLKHAHSHVAFLGWVFNALFILIIHNSLPITKPIKWQFYLFQVSVIGMLVSFPLQGYGPISIVLSTAHIFISVWFYFSVICKLSDSDPGVRWIKIGGLFMLISNAGPLMLAPIMILDLKDSFLFQYSLQHYLHFQYNGWFIVTILGLLVKYFQPKLNEKLLLVLLAWSTIPLLFLSVELIESNIIYKFIGGIAALAQLVGSILFSRSLVIAIDKESNFMKIALPMVLLWFVIKCFLQLAIVFPSMSSDFIQSHHAIIGYLHLIFLGVITNFLILIFYKSHFVKELNTSKMGFWIFNIGVVVMIKLLMLSPLVIIQPYFLALFISAIVIVFGMILIASNKCILVTQDRDRN